jgi:hypothetical protein
MVRLQRRSHVAVLTLADNPDLRPSMPTRTAPEALSYPVVVGSFVPVVLLAEEVEDGFGGDLAFRGAVGAHGAEAEVFAPPVPEADVVDGLGAVWFVACWSAHGVKRWSTERNIVAQNRRIC